MTSAHILPANALRKVLSQTCLVTQIFSVSRLPAHVRNSCGTHSSFLYMSSKKTLTQTRYPVLRPADKVGMGKGRRGSKRRNEVEPWANFAADRALEYIYFFSKVTSILRSAVSRAWATVTHLDSRHRFVTGKKNCSVRGQGPLE